MGNIGVSAFKFIRNISKFNIAKHDPKRVSQPNIALILSHCVAWYQAIRLLYGVLLKEDDVSIGRGE